jgi:glycosyltransferase involved in cell wall biosynthesis
MARRARFTACLITKDEEFHLPAALASVAFADEIIVVDSHSKDRTRDIASAFRPIGMDGVETAPRVIERDWPGHVEQKNFAIEQAAHDWVLCLDADERISPELRREIEAALTEDPPGVAGFTMPRKTRYLGRWILRSGWYPDRKLRLFRKSRGKWGGTNPHDHVYVEGAVKDLSGDIYHYSYRNLSDHLRTINFFTDIAAREKAHRGVRWPLLRMLFQPPFKFFKMYVLQQGFREGQAGFLVAVLGMFYVFLKYAKLWEIRGREWKDAPIQ